jgi:RNase H-fold protein (predicted Holliday junction resolvase)
METIVDGRGDRLRCLRETEEILPESHCRGYKKQFLAFSIEIQDEDLTTFEAQESLGKLESEDHLDDIAASIILQRFIDKQ